MCACVISIKLHDKSGGKNHFDLKDKEADMERKLIQGQSMNSRNRS